MKGIKLTKQQEFAFENGVYIIVGRNGGKATLHCYLRGITQDGIIVMNPYVPDNPHYDHYFDNKSYGRLWAFTEDELKEEVK